MPIDYSNIPGLNLPTGPVSPPNLTGGSASDTLTSLLGYDASRAAAADSQATDILGGRGLAGSAYANAIGNQNTSVGLSPQALAALRTQNTSGINDQYQSAAQALNSALLRRGAAGSSQLPGYGGDISRAYQPLYSAMEAAKTKGQTDTILADEAAKQKSLYQNQQLALQAAQGVNSGATNLFNAGTGALGQSGSIANALAQIETPNIWKLLGTQGLTSLLTGTGAGGAATDEIKKLLGIGTQNPPAGQLGDIAGTIPPGVLGAVQGSGTSSPGLPELGPQPLPPGFGAPPEGTVTSSSTTPTLAQTAEVGAPAAGAAALPAALGGGEAALQAAPEALTAGIAGLGTAGGILGAVPGAGIASTGVAGLGGAAALPAGFGAPAAADTAALSTASSGGLGSTMAALATNPITWGVAAVIAGAIIWHKSQSHQTADQWTKGNQAPFDQQMAQVSDKWAQAKASGQVTPEMAQQTRDAAQQLIDTYQHNLADFASKGKKNMTVAKQAQATAQQYYGNDYANFLGQFTA